MKILLVRHGESIGNVDPSNYLTTFDPFISLTKKGEEQATLVGNKIIEELDLLKRRSKFSKNNEIKVMYSPYLRTTHTKDLILEVFKNKEVMVNSVEESPLLREQEYKFFDSMEDSKQTQSERSKFGHFWYRFKNAESIADVYQREVIFLNDLKMRIMTNELKAYENGYIIIVAHAITIACLRLILERQPIEKLDTELHNCQSFLYTFNIKNEKQKLIKII